MNLQQAIDEAWAAAGRTEGLPQVPALMRLAIIRALLAPWVSDEKKP